MSMSRPAASTRGASVPASRDMNSKPSMMISNWDDVRLFTSRDDDRVGGNTDRSASRDGLWREPITAQSGYGFGTSDHAYSEPGSAPVLFHETNSEAGGSVSNAALAAMTAHGVTDIATQHYEWAQELETVDQKQADLAVLQWKLVRNQTGMLARQLFDLRKHVEELDHQQELWSRKVEEASQDSEAFEDRVKAFVRQLFEKSEHNVTRMRQEIDQEVQRRDEGDLDLKRRLDQISDEIGRNNQAEHPLDNDVRSLKVELSAQKALLPGLREHVQIAVEEIRTSLDNLIEDQRKAKDGFERERRDRLHAHEELQEKVQGFLGKERAERELHHSTLNSLLQGSVNSYTEEITALRGRVQEVEARIHQAHKEHMSALDAKFAEPVSKLQHIERRFEHVQASIAQECESRASLHEVFDQMLKNERTKLTNLITQKANIARLDCEEIQRVLQERLDKERGERETNNENQTVALARCKAALTDQFGTVTNECQVLLNEARSALAESRGAEHMFRKLENELSAVRNSTLDARREAMQGLSEERAAREVGQQHLVEQLGWLGDHHDRMREVFVQKNERKNGQSDWGPSTNASETRARQTEPIGVMGSPPRVMEPVVGTVGSSPPRMPPAEPITRFVDSAVGGAMSPPARSPPAEPIARFADSVVGAAISHPPRSPSTEPVARLVEPIGDVLGSFPSRSSPRTPPHRDR